MIINSRNNGVPNSVTGPITWKVLHYLAEQFPDNPSKIQQKYLYDFIMSLTTTYPCEMCRREMSIYFAETNFSKKMHLKNNRTIVVYLFTFHNAVNERLGKPRFSFQRICDYEINEQDIFNMLYYFAASFPNPPVITIEDQREYKKMIAALNGLVDGLMNVGQQLDDTDELDHRSFEKSPISKALDTRSSVFQDRSHFFDFVYEMNAYFNNLHEIDGRSIVDIMNRINILCLY